MPRAPQRMPRRVVVAEAPSCPDVRARCTQSGQGAGSAAHGLAPTAGDRMPRDRMRPCLISDQLETTLAARAAATRRTGAIANRSRAGRSDAKTRLPPSLMPRVQPDVPATAAAPT
eukprot:200964-Prymnesium_polylepis.2